MNPWTIAWLVWLGAFVAIEGPALANKTPDDTLSEHVWKWFATRKEDMQHRGKTKGWVKVRRLALVSFLVWLLLHFALGGEWV